jgi:hypothetical protein
MLAHEPIYGGRGSGRLAQCLHTRAVVAAELCSRLVARRGELGRRQSVQAIDDLVDRHAVILTA